MSKIASTVVFLQKVIATIHIYQKYFPCTRLLSSKHQIHRENSLKVRNKAPSQYMQLFHGQVCSVWAHTDCFDHHPWLLAAAADKGRLLHSAWTDEFLPADYEINPNRWCRKSLGRSTSLLCLVLEEVIDGQMAGDNTSCPLFGSLVLGMGSAEAWQVWDLGPHSSSVWCNTSCKLAL